MSNDPDTAGPDGETPDEAADQAPDQAPAAEDETVEQPEQPARVRRRLSPATAVVALLLLLLGFTMVWQMRSVATDPTLAAARQEDLVRILADLDTHEDRLRQDIAELEETLGRLTTAGESQQEALAEAARRADELGILAGSLPAAGPGLVMEIRAGPAGLSAATLLDAVQELRGAGAEAIQVTDAQGNVVRVVGSTYFVDDASGGVQVDGQVLRGPFTVTAIGEPHTLHPALTIPGGVVESVRGAGGNVTVREEPDGVEVSAVRDPRSLRYAQPVS